MLVVFGVLVAQMIPNSGRWVMIGTLAVADRITCGLGFCDPEVPDGMTIVAVTDDLGTAPIVALDVSPQGRLLAAHSGRLDNGVLDNRDFNEAELDEELALATVADRVAMIERFVERGRNASEDFTSAEDVVAVFEDRDGDGSLETRTVLARTNEPAAGIGAGVLVHDDVTYWAAIPDLWMLRDTDGDGLPEAEQRASTGWGVRWAFGGHDLHGLILGPDGKIYFSVGDRGFAVELPDGRILQPSMDAGRGAILRMNPDGSALEVFAEGLRNPQELAFDDFGNLFTVDNNSDSIDEARIVHVVEGGDSGWMMPYQLLRDEAYERGPWNAERLWHPRHDGQPAYVIPPLRFIGRGPAGFAHVPGLGLPERYRDHFLVADYMYWQPFSGIRAFRVEPEGAGFRATEPEWFVENVLVTDFAFAPDGSMYLSHYKHLPPRRGGIDRLSLDDETRATQAERIQEMEGYLREGLAQEPTAKLVALLGFEDRRIRLRAQLELVRRRAVAELDGVARDPDADLLARVHALWGLGQLGPAGVQSWPDLAWLADQPDEIRGQAVRAVGQASAERLAPALIPFLSDPNLRVRFFAAQSIGQLGHRAGAPALAEMLRENADRDVYLRHAAAVALHRFRDAEHLRVLARDASASVRMAALLALRRARSPEVAQFLSDQDPRLVVEAARAIHDLGIEEAASELAALAGSRLPYADEDPQTSFALHRRVVNANLREGTAEAALRLGAHAADEKNPLAMRALALDALQSFTAPEPRDAVLGTWHPLDERPATVVHAAIDDVVPALIGTELEAQALAMAGAYGRVPLDDDELGLRVADARAAPALRIASLRALGARTTLQNAALRDAVEVSLDSRVPTLRAEARDVLAARDPERALLEVDAVADRSPVVERQRAIETLVRVGTAPAADRIGDELARLREGSLPADVALDVLDAARALDQDALRDGISAWEEGLDPKDPLAGDWILIEGGDRRRGAQVFNGNGDCKRCHSIDGEGGKTGPSLSGLSRRRDPEEILEAVLLPNATIVAGYEQDVGGSAMPPVGRELPQRELRDLMAYLTSLR